MSGCKEEEGERERESARGKSVNPKLPQTRAQQPSRFDHIEHLLLVKV